jgi:hypothetical protein
MDEQDQHLGTKLQAVADELGLDKKQLASHFGMQTPSIYDTLKFGRLDKRHYQALVNLNGKSLEWWFDVTPPVRASEPMGRYTLSQSQSLKSEIQTLYERLPPSEQEKVKQDLQEKVAYFDRLFEELKSSR